ncbi:unnamed protein product, partial [Rotaria magnacalcarata]
MSPRDSTEQLSNSNIKSNDSIPSYNTTEVAYHSPPRETGSESEDDHSEKPNTPEDKSSSLNASQVKPARQ